VVLGQVEQGAGVCGPGEAVGGLVNRAVLSRAGRLAALLVSRVARRVVQSRSKVAGFDEVICGQLVGEGCAEDATHERGENVGSLGDQAVGAGGDELEGVREAIVNATHELIMSAGLASLTTREIARRARVSEASIHYHFGGKTGLLQAVILDGLEPLKELGGEVIGGDTGERPVGEVLLALAQTLEGFFDRALPVLETIQADPRLRASFSKRLAAEDLGPHRGVELVERYLGAAQRAGRIDGNADTAAAALGLGRVLSSRVAAPPHGKATPTEAPLA
jgi:AcrR family transcriptional regulator